MSAVAESERAEAPRVFGIPFSDVGMDELAYEFAAVPTSGQGVRAVVTANLDHIVQLRSSAGLRDAYRHSWRRTLDGTPVWLYARLRGAANAQRVTGADLFPRVMKRLRPGTHRPFFVVAEEKIGDRLVEWLVGRGFDRAAVQCVVPPFGFENDADHGAGLSRRIREHGATQLFFGVGCPRSEAWIDRHRHQLGDVYAMAVGAALAFFAGVDRRAPKLMRDTGTEWLWRVALEPGRLGPRYFVRSWGFLAAVAADLSGRTRKI